MALDRVGSYPEIIASGDDLSGTDFEAGCRGRAPRGEFGITG